MIRILDIVKDSIFQHAWTRRRWAVIPRWGVVVLLGYNAADTDALGQLPDSRFHPAYSVQAIAGDTGVVGVLLAGADRATAATVGADPVVGGTENAPDLSVLALPAALGALANPPMLGLPC